jgi:hypothetical protein
MAISRSKRAVNYLHRELERIRKAHQSYAGIPEPERSENVKRCLIELGAQDHWLSTHICVLEEILLPHAPRRVRRNGRTAEVQDRVRER